MTYSTGGLIQASDYNGFVQNNASNVNAVWGTGSGSSGWGQTALGTVATGGTVTATQWATLNNTITAMHNQTGVSITARTSPVAGNVIAVLANLNTDITNIAASKGNATGSGTQFTGWTGTSSKTASTGSGSAAWTITFTQTVTWASANAARYFFNAGGLVKVQFSKTSTGTVADAEWNNFVNTVCGSIFISGGAATQTINGTSYTGVTKVGGTGTPSILATTAGWYNLTTSNTTVYKQFDVTAPYTGDYVQVQAATAGAGTQLVLTTTWVSTGDTNPGSTAQISGGTATTGIVFGTAPATVATYFPPSSTYLPTASWGTPTVTATTV